MKLLKTDLRHANQDRDALRDQLRASQTELEALSTLAAQPAIAPDAAAGPGSES